MGSTKYPKTVKAMLAEESSAWAVVDALADELELDNDGQLPHGSIVQILADLESAGLDREASSVANYAHAARTLQTSTPGQRKVIRSAKSAIAVGLVAKAGMTPEAIVNEISTCTGFGLNRARAVVAELNAKKRGKPAPTTDYDAVLCGLSTKIVDTLTEAGTDDLEPKTLAYLHMMAKAVLSITGEEVAIADEVDEGLRRLEEFLHG